MLGVELDEEFYLKSNLTGKYLSSGKNKTTFKLSESGVEYKFIRNTNNYEWCSLDAILAEVLTGSQEIVKKPWKPKHYEDYYYVNVYCGKTDKTNYNKYFVPDVLRANSGNCYRTQEEAEKHVDEWMTKVYSKDWRELLK